jgi:hypothetical protein
MTAFAEPAGLGQGRIRSRSTHRHFAIFRSRSKPNSSNEPASGIADGGQRGGGC